MLEPLASSSWVALRQDQLVLSGPRGGGTPTHQAVVVVGGKAGVLGLPSSGGSWWPQGADGAGR